MRPCPVPKPDGCPRAFAGGSSSVRPTERDSAAASSARSCLASDSRDPASPAQTCAKPSLLSDPKAGPGLTAARSEGPFDLTRSSCSSAVQAGLPPRGEQGWEGTAAAATRPSLLGQPACQARRRINLAFSFAWPPSPACPTAILTFSLLKDSRQPVLLRPSPSGRTQPPGLKRERARTE